MRREVEIEKNGYVKTITITWKTICNYYGWEYTDEAEQILDDLWQYNIIDEFDIIHNSDFIDWLKEVYFNDKIN